MGSRLLPMQTLASIGCEVDIVALGTSNRDQRNVCRTGPADHPRLERSGSGFWSGVLRQQSSGPPATRQRESLA
eukprot:3902370-Lingulodinium_polyedra.AAC.1